MAIKHIHKLKKHKYPKTGNSIFFCTLPECNYKCETELVVGKESICNICGDVFIMNEVTINLLRPHCSGCGKRAIKDAEGKKRFIRVKKGSEILTAIAADERENLRSRLDSLISKEEDI